MAVDARLGVIGLGNVFAADDGAGIRAVRHIRDRLSDERVRIIESERWGMDLLELLSGLDSAIIVDAALSGFDPPGHISTFVILTPFRPGPRPSLHTMDLSGLLAFGEAIGMSLPRTVQVMTVEAEDLYTFREACTPEVERAIPQLVDMLLTQIRRIVPDVHELTSRIEEALVR